MQTQKRKLQEVGALYCNSVQATGYICQISKKKKKYNLSFKSFFVADNMACFLKKSFHACSLYDGWDIL